MKLSSIANSFQPIRVPLIAALIVLHTGDAAAHQSSESIVEALTGHLHEHPDDAKLLLQRGIELSNTGRYEEALVDLARAANLGEKTRATFQRGVVFYRLGQFQKALECFNSTLVAEPRNASALEYRARLRRDMGDGQGAVSDFRALIALRVYVNPGYYLAAAKLLAKSGDAHIPEAVSLLDDGIRDLGPVPQLQRYAIELELARNAPKAAIARLTSLAPSEGDGPEWQAQMGDLYLAAGDRPEAKLWWQKAQKTINQRRTTPAQTVLSQRLEANLKQY